MHWPNVKLILHREIRDQLRDRRTLLMVTVVPVLLYPLLGMAMLQLSQFMHERPLRLLVVGAYDLGDLPPLLGKNGQFSPELFANPSDAERFEVDALSPRQQRAAGLDSREAVQARVQEAPYDAALYFEPDFADRVRKVREAVTRPLVPAAKGSPARRLELPPPMPDPILRNPSSKKARMAGSVWEVLDRWTGQIGEGNLRARGVRPEAVMSRELLFVRQPLGEALRAGCGPWPDVLPLLLVIWALTGAFYPAVDLCAGEKERGTLETLLSSPARRSEIVLGKLLTIMLFSAVTAALNILSMSLTGSLFLQRLPGIPPPPLAGLAWLAVALPPIAALFSALALAVASFARSTKEGQYYLMPLLVITAPLAILPIVSGMELSLGTSLIPVTGLVLLLRAALDGSAWQAVQYALPVAAVTLAGCMLAIRWAIEQFNSETVLFREGERLDLLLWLRHLLRERRPTPTSPAALLCGVTILCAFFYVSPAMPMPDGLRSVALIAFISQVVVILTPALLMTIMLTASPRQTLRLHWPRWTTLPMAAALGVAIYPVAVALRALIWTLYPMHAKATAIEDLNRLLTSLPLPWILLLFALLPAVCEELAFRGFILSGFQTGGRKWRAIGLSAVFFAFTHGILQQSLAAFVLGVVLGLLAVQTRSILPGLLVHAIHNALVLAAGRMPKDAAEAPGTWASWLVRPQDPWMAASWLILAAGAVLTGAILIWFLRLRPPHEESRETQPPSPLAPRP